MLDLLTSVTPQVSAICQRYGVRHLGVFGSALRADFDPSRSDVDVVVEFQEPISEKTYVDNYFSLIADLSCLFGRKVDLLTWKSIRNPYLRSEVESTQKILYAA